MGVWTILSWSGLCAVGAVLFLRIVADALGAVSQNLACREQAARRESERRAVQQPLEVETAPRSAVA
jgi:hypothetical protein